MSLDNRLEAMNRREEALRCIDWETCPFTKDDIPHGTIRMNEAGNYYLACPDKTFYYINQDGGVYHKGLSEGASLYTSPQGKVYQSPSKTAPIGGEYFWGIDWESTQREMYHKDHAGNIVRTPQKNVDWKERPQLPIKNIDSCHSGGNELFYDVDDQGEYGGDNAIICGILAELERLQPRLNEANEEDDAGLPGNAIPARGRNLFYEFREIKVLEEDPVGVDESIPEATQSLVDHGDDIICSLPPCSQKAARARPHNMVPGEAQRESDIKHRRRQKLITRVRIEEQQ